MALPASRKKKTGRSLINTLPEMLDTAIAGHNDFILTFETDPDTGRRKIHIFSGRFVSPCMLRKLAGLAESQRDEGSIMVSGKWQKAGPDCAGSQRKVHPTRGMHHFHPTPPEV